MLADGRATTVLTRLERLARRSSSSGAMSPTAPAGPSPRCSAPVRRTASTRTTFTSISPAIRARADPCLSPARTGRLDRRRPSEYAAMSDAAGRLHRLRRGAVARRGRSIGRSRTSGAAIASTGRRHDADRLTGLEHGLVAAGQASRSFRPFADALRPISPGAPSVQARRRQAAMPGKDRALHRARESGCVPLVPSPACHLPRPPEPRRMWKSSSTTGKRCSSTSGSVRREFVMWVCTAGSAVEARAGRSAGADRLVILMALIAEGQVVHRALRRRQRTERREQAIRHRLAGLDIAGNDRRRIAPATASSPPG